MPLHFLYYAAAAMLLDFATLSILCRRTRRYTIRHFYVDDTAFRFVRRLITLMLLLLLRYAPTRDVTMDYCHAAAALPLTPALRAPIQMDTADAECMPRTCAAPRLSPQLLMRMRCYARYRAAMR